MDEQLPASVLSLGMVPGFPQVDGAPLKVKPFTSYLSEQIVKKPESKSGKEVLETAKTTGRTAWQQVMDAYTSNQSAITREEASQAKYAGLAVNYESPDVRRALESLQSLQGNAPEVPSARTPDDPTIGQRAISVLASLFRPRMSMGLYAQPFEVQKQLAKEADARDMADYGRADSRFKNLLAATNTQLGIAQRDETAQRNSYAGMANKASGTAATLRGQSGSMLARLLASSDAEANRLSREVIAGQKIDFERDKATNRLKFDQSKLKAWIDDRGHQLAEEIRYHTGLLDAKDIEMAQAQARIEAANLMDQYKIQWGQNKDRREDEALNQKDAAAADSAARQLRKDAKDRLMKLSGNANAIQEKAAKLQQQIQQATAMLATEGDEKKREATMQQIASAKYLLSVYEGQLADVQDMMRTASEEATAPPPTSNGGGGEYPGSGKSEASGGARRESSANPLRRDQTITVDGVEYVIDATPDNPIPTNQHPGGAGPVQSGKSLPSVNGRGPKNSKSSVSGRGGSIGYTVIKPGGK